MLMDKRNYFPKVLVPMKYDMIKQEAGFQHELHENVNKS